MPFLSLPEFVGPPESAVVNLVRNAGKVLVDGLMNASPDLLQGRHLKVLAKVHLPPVKFRSLPAHLPQMLQILLVADQQIHDFMAIMLLDFLPPLLQVLERVLIGEVEDVDNPHDVVEEARG